MALALSLITKSHHECRFEYSGVALLVILGAIRYNAALISLGAIYIVIENILTPIYLYPVITSYTQILGYTLPVQSFTDC